MKISSLCFSVASMAFLGGIGAVQIDDGQMIVDVAPGLQYGQALEKRKAVKCAEIDCLASIKALGGPATSFCRAYLSLPSVTTGPSSTVTVTTTNTVAGSPTVTTVTVTTSSVVVIPQNPRLAKRTAAPASKDCRKRPPPVPAQLGRFAAAEISSACSCLNLAPSTVPGSTVTVTATSVITGLGSTITSTETVTTCGQPGAACTLYDNCCNGICELYSSPSYVYSCL